MNTKNPIQQQQPTSQPENSNHSAISQPAATTNQPPAATSKPAVATNQPEAAANSQPAS
jgi:hypothetical protein